MYRWFGRIGIFLLLLLWLSAGVQLLAGKGEANEALVAEVFSEIGETEQESVVEYYGQLTGKQMIRSLDKRETYLRRIAQSLGIYDGIVISRTYGEENQTTILAKKGANAQTKLRLVTWREEGEIDRQTLFVNISLEDDLEMALRLRRKLKNILDEEMEEKRSFACVTGKYQGKLSLEKRNQIAERLLGGVKADIISENRDMQLYTIYGYTPYLKETVKLGNRCMNVNIAMYYSKTENATIVYGGVPMVGIDY